MPGYKSKKAMSDSRFAVTYEDPDYDIDFEDIEIDELEYTEFPEVAEDFNPFNTSNS